MGKVFLQSIIVLDTATQNTDQEVKAALQRFSEKGCQRGILVSSPTHLPRCLACACKVTEDDEDLFTGAIYASPTGTCYDNARASDVVVIEPPHRGDRDKSLDDLPYHQMVRRFFGIGSSERKREFLTEFDKLLENYGV